MASTTTGREKLPAVTPTLTQLFINRVEATPSREAFRAPTDDGNWATTTWKETGDDVNDLAAGLIALGCELEQRVGIAAETSLDWVLADLAVAVAGGAVTTVYASTGAEDVAYILSDSDSRLLFAQDESQVAKVRAKRSELPDLRKIILMKGEPVAEDGDWVITMDALRELGKEKLKAEPDVVKNRSAQVTPELLATLIYTSGTTGKPKGVELTQGNWGYIGAGLDGLDVIHVDDVQFLWLPLAHVFGSVLIATQLQIGFVTAVDGRVPKIVENLPVVQPTFMAGVPRIFEKVYAGVQGQFASESGAKAKIIPWAFGVGKRYKDAELANGKAPGGLLGAQFGIADKLVFSKIRDRLGGHVRYFISGSAALSSEIAEWFNIIGMPILEGYGLTETSAATSIVRPDNIKFGTVGEPLPATEVKIAADGEILIKGGGVMRGYHNKPDATAEVFVGDGYFATGDIGEIDAMGRVKITDRKKDLVKTSGGKYIAPSAIESQFKAVCGIAGNMVVHANNRKFASALITLDPDAAAKWATEHGKSTDLTSLSKDPDMIAYIQSSVDQLNSGLNKWETIKKFEILDRDFTVDEGELTPSLKVKRKVVEERYSDLLNSLYS
ncbi:MAG: long-chain fatty acid--CoA ligase [Candidatus Nanopelagicales bacterium]|nr:long-chain fatty acid--CoA ligase [Candidatus Nanopelagicales bacterium]